MTPELIDPEVAAATFDTHLRDFFTSGRGRGEGWCRIDLDDLHTVVQLPAVRENGTVDCYFVRLGAEYYDVWPPTVAVVRKTQTGEWVEAAEGTRWWPNQRNAPGFSFGLHPRYAYPDQSIRQLVCFSHSFDYYLSSHTANDPERWRHGTHTVSATLSRIAQALHAPNYIGPSGDRDS